MVTSVIKFVKAKKFVTCLLLLSNFALPAYASDWGPRTFNVERSWTAIVAAYAPEIDAINRAITMEEQAVIEQVVTLRGVKYQIGKYKGEPVVIFTTGISVTNAAMTMQMALDYFPIDKVLMMGIAGAVNPVFNPGDISVPERWYYHDESVYVNPDVEKPGQYTLPDYYAASLDSYRQRREKDAHSPNYENLGFMFPNEVWVIKDGWEKPKKMPYFTATPELVELARNAVEKVGKITMPGGKAISIKIGGNGVTGSVFADNSEYRSWLDRVFKAEITEMESAAVAQVCFVNEVDWLIIRSVSDLAGGQKGKNEENVFDAIASGTGTKLLFGLLDEISLEE